ncbi:MULTISPECIES: lacticin 481 family lantibiotic [Auritidibacter]|uniref:Lacticin 481 family lantibiotic n=1 Tax=Auritidibacter ignavus TaxID=678932 RepID=A0AAJ6AJX4_9MICC|nr:MULTISPECIES: lacticin 481 family lantibiotic [Auritidibacter]PXA82341.1 lantibiotic lacticin [Auritidibacter sp. NML120779]AXR74272.1 type A2 lantipeptide [Auritidibacter sp. NML130574]WGH82979.1 lacticin 481 family lantibiotic [Auritidibacter ignavus]WGH92258.1 lacticin 481 family lantibiotic [Auritidibacter ignavus]WHS34067.1 lacticin 481 family lantibiotic [Auritidibacter ignavus]
MKAINHEAATALQELTDNELDQILGADGVISTLTHECHMNSWQGLLTCCS